MLGFIHLVYFFPFIYNIRRIIEEQKVMNDNEIVVSVITPTYNHEKYIGRCIESVLSQTYSNLEMIIIDDGSTDRTENIVKEYEDSRIVFIKQEHKGIEKLGETYNKAFEKSSGSMIAVLEGDDFWPPYKLERQLPSMKKEGIVLSWGVVGVVNSKGELIRKFPPKSYRFESMERELFFKELLLNDPIHSSTVIIKREALEKIGGFQQYKDSPFVDYSTYLSLFLLGEFSFINEVLGYWRVHEEQTSFKRSPILAEKGFLCALGFYQSLPKGHELKRELDEKEIRNSFAKKISYSYYKLGRLNLLRGAWKSAREHFLKAMRQSPLSTKTKSLMGIIFSLMHLDMEWLVSLAGKKSLKWVFKNGSK